MKQFLTVLVLCGSFTSLFCSESTSDKVTQIVQELKPFIVNVLIEKKKASKDLNLYIEKNFETLNVQDKARCREELSESKILGSKKFKDLRSDVFPKLNALFDFFALPMDFGSSDQETIKQHVSYVLEGCIFGEISYDVAEYLMTKHELDIDEVNRSTGRPFTTIQRTDDSLFGDLDGLTIPAIFCMKDSEIAGLTDANGRKADGAICRRIEVLVRPYRNYWKVTFTRTRDAFINGTKSIEELMQSLPRKEIFDEFVKPAGSTDDFYKALDNLNPVLYGDERNSMLGNFGFVGRQSCWEHIAPDAVREKAAQEVARALMHAFKNGCLDSDMTRALKLFKKVPICVDRHTVNGENLGEVYHNLGPLLKTTEDLIEDQRKERDPKELAKLYAQFLTDPDHDVAFRAYIVSHKGSKRTREKVAYESIKLEFLSGETYSLGYLSSLLAECSLANLKVSVEHGIKNSELDIFAMMFAQAYAINFGEVPWHEITHDGKPIKDYFARNPHSKLAQYYKVTQEQKALKTLKDESSAGSQSSSHGLDDGSSSKKSDKSSSVEPNRPKGRSKGSPRNKQSQDLADKHASNNDKENLGQKPRSLWKKLAFGGAVVAVGYALYKMSNHASNTARTSLA